MHHRPFPHQIQSPAWQLALDYLQGADVNGGFELAVSSVKMRWRMVVVKHTDQDPIERADRRHFGEVDSTIWQDYSREVVSARTAIFESHWPYKRPNRPCRPPIRRLASHKEQSTTDRLDRFHIAELRSESSHRRETARPTVHGNAAEFRAVVERALKETGGPLKLENARGQGRCFRRANAEPSRGRPRERNSFSTLAG